MSKAFENNNLRGGASLRAIALTMTLSVAAFGCATSPFHTDAEPVSAARAGGSVTPSVTTTPGSAGVSIPSTMVSSAVDPSLVAVAVLEASRGYQGRVLGPAAPGQGAPSMSQQIATGQLISPSILASPQMSVNSSAPVPNIASGAAGVVGVEGFANAIAGTTNANVGTTNAIVGMTGLSNTTATGLTNVTSPASLNGNGLAMNTMTTAVAATTGTVSNVRVVTRNGRTVVTNQQQ